LSRYKISVLGAGSWGITLAILLSENRHRVHLWEYHPEFAKRLNRIRESKDKLPGIKIPKSVLISNQLEKVLENSDIILFVIPSHTLRQVALSVKKYKLKKNVIFVSAIKGIENDSLLRMSQIIQQILPQATPERMIVLSGPSHAEEVARHLPTTIVAACHKLERARIVQNVFMRPYFRVYTNQDVIGVETAGALKNIIAIAAGIADGIGFGSNSKSALLTRGLFEISRLGVHLGAKALTFAGLAGMGDLITTCISPYSRNRYVGEHIGQGENLKKILSSMKMVAEGVKTTRSAYALSKKYQIEMPITQEVYRVLFKAKSPQKAVLDLMTRRAKTEIL